MELGRGEEGGVVSSWRVEGVVYIPKGCGR